MSAQDFAAIAGVLGGIFLFGWALYEWKDSQQWRRAEKLDSFIHSFDTQPLLVFGRFVLDWTRRTVQHGDQTVTITNADSIEALRVDRDHYENCQPLIRDALDALLTFFERLSIATQTRLVDSQHARKFFRYWLTKLVTYNAHPCDSKDIPAELMAKYIAVYANIEAILSLCTAFDVSARELETTYDATRVADYV